MPRSSRRSARARRRRAPRRRIAPTAMRDDVAHQVGRRTRACRPAALLVGDRDARVAVRRDLDEADALEPLQRLAHRGARDAEPLGELVVAQALPGREACRRGSPRRGARRPRRRGRCRAGRRGVRGSGHGWISVRRDPSADSRRPIAPATSAVRSRPLASSRYIGRVCGVTLRRGLSGGIRRRPGFEHCSARASDGLRPVVADGLQHLCHHPKPTSRRGAHLR